MTAFAAMILGGIAALIAMPYVQTYTLLKSLSNPHPGERAKAIRDGIRQVWRNPDMLRRLDEHLPSADDTQFLAIATILQRLSKFHTPTRDPVLVDRYNCLLLQRTRWDNDPNGAAESRSDYLNDIILGGRDNAYVRAALAEAMKDDSPRVRRFAPVLAAMLGDDAALKTLLADTDAEVASNAALDAGLAGRSALVPVLGQMVKSDNIEQASSAAFAMARMKTDDAPALLCKRLGDARDDLLRERLLLAMPVLNDKPAAGAVANILAASSAGGFPPAMAILAAGKLQTLGDPNDQKILSNTVKAVLVEAAKKGNVTESQAMAALEVVGRLDMDVAREVYDLCEKRWSPRLTLAMTRAAEVLGRQAAKIETTDPNFFNQCVSLLRRAAVYDEGAATRPASGPALWLTTPIASAAAACALWNLKTTLADEYVRNVCRDDTGAGGDAIAWRLGRKGGKEVMELGMAMLPPPVDPNLPLAGQPTRVYNPCERTAGGLLLAVAARTPEQKAQAIARINLRLKGVSGKSMDFIERDSLRCALLMLGQKEHIPVARDLLSVYEFPPRRVVTALLMGGDEKYVLDWLLWGQHSDEEIDLLLTLLEVSPVLQEFAKQLPTVDPAASLRTRLWQVRILRHAYILQRKGFSIQRN